VFTDGAALVTETVALLQRRASVRNVAIALDIEPGLPLLHVDPVEFEQVLVNLINNAIDALPDGGQIRIGVHRDGVRVRVSVADNGTGIAPQDLPHHLKLLPKIQKYLFQ
jgi:signal transduction histidine kinase